MASHASVKELVLWTHESTTADSDAIVNVDLIPGFIPEIHLLDIDTKTSHAGQSPNLAAKNAKTTSRRVVVSPLALSAEQRRKTPNLQISILNHLGTSFGITSRSIVTVSVATKAYHVADYMVMYFKDQYISRSDMWRAACNLEGQCIYVGKRITFTGGIRADVREIWRGGKKKFSAYVGANTKPVFRSESARYLIFIQMSREMWEFEEDGELFYNKAIDGFLPELFKRWKKMKAHHLVSIVLFTRVAYKGVVGPFCLPKTSAPYTESEMLRIRALLDQTYHNDFYKIVVDNVSSNNWEATLTELKRELHGFSRDVLSQRMRHKVANDTDTPEGQLTAAMDGNLLEAINMAAHQFNRDYIDRDLLRTGTSMLFVTAGTGVFEVNERLLKLTGEALLGNGIGMDIVCLSRRPLHVVPLFKYKREANRDAGYVDDFEYILPYICEISYYGELHDTIEENVKFQPRLKMQNLQMRDRQERVITEGPISYLGEHPLFKNRELTKPSNGMDARMDLYDDLCFANKPETHTIIRGANDEGPPTPGEEVIKLLGTSVPSSGDKKNFRSLYELSKVTSATNSGVDLPLSKASGTSNNSVMSVASLGSSNHISPKSTYEPRPGSSPAKSRSITVRLMHRISDRASDARGASQVPNTSTKQHATFFRNPGDALMSLKSRPSIMALAGAVTISSAMQQKHLTVVTKGFAIPEQEIITSKPPASTDSAFAIPIRPKETEVPLHPSSVLNRKRMTSIEIGEAKVQSVSQSLRGQFRNRRHSSNRSRTSLTIKYKAPKPESSDASPWHVLSNPSYPSKNLSTLNTKAWRWAHVSDRARRSGDMNWESMCAPAALPLTTTAIIDLEALKSSLYSENSYSIYIDSDDQPLSQRELLREMIGQRLVQGYQIAQNPISDHQSTGKHLSVDDGGGKSRASLWYGPLGNMGDTVYLTHAQMEVQCISCDSSGHMIEVTRFVRKNNPLKPIGYSSLIWQLAQDDGYEDMIVVFRPIPTNHSWNYVDQIICGVEKRFNDSVRFWRARFLLIPNDLRDKKNVPPIAGVSEHFTEEEIRLAGINKMCELLQKASYLTPSEQKIQARSPRAGTTQQVSVAFTTLDPTAYVAHENQHFYRSEEATKSLESTTKQLIARDLSLHDFSNEMQSAKGIQIKDRLWHWRWYEGSWIGSDFVTWLVDRTDIASRDEATHFAQGLMEQGLFEHVQKTHGFLDGFYLYRLRMEYASKTAKTWFGTRKVTPSAVPTRNRASSNVSGSTISSPVLKPQKVKNKFELSKWMRIDVDPHKKSHRPEFVTVHYDCIHNPDTCYHIRLEWIAITGKLVEETIQQWARITEKYGLTLVEAPVDEAVAVTSSNPFRAPLAIELSLEPPPLFPEQSNVVTTEDREVWMARILLHWNFVLDQEAAHKFPRQIDVEYSWGRPSYRYTQYIHRSGMSLCQITPDGFLWLTNRLYVSRAASTAPMASLPSPIRINSSINAGEPDNLRNQFRQWCGDPEKLRVFFKEAHESAAHSIHIIGDTKIMRPHRRSSGDDKSSVFSVALSQ